MNRRIVALGIVMLFAGSVDVTTTPTFRVGTPKVLFKLPGPLVASSPEGVSRDGQQFVFALPAAAGAR